MSVTKQETFNQIWNGMQAQGWFPSEINVGRESGAYCAYRGDQGRKCHAGHLIPDNRYDPRMEMGGVQVPDGLYMSEASTLVTDVMSDLGHDLAFVKECQEVHDMTTSNDERKAQMVKLAGKYGLTVPA